MMHYMKQKQKMLKLLPLAPLLHVHTLFLHTGYTKLYWKNTIPSNWLHDSEFHFVKFNTSYKQYPI